MMIQLDLRGHIGKLPSEEESPASLLGPICWNSYLPENMAGWKTHHERVDVFPIEHGDFPASHVSFQECILPYS